MKLLRGDALARPYVEADLLSIAKLQLRTEDDRAMHTAGKPQKAIVCDTDLITIRIWGEEKYGRSDPWVIEQIKDRPYDLWLLCRPDIPWEFDPQRENPHDRDRLFVVHEALLKSLGKPYAIVEGDPDERRRKAVLAMDRLGPIK